MSEKKNMHIKYFKKKNIASSYFATIKFFSGFFLFISVLFFNFYVSIYSVNSYLNDEGGTHIEQTPVL